MSIVHVDAAAYHADGHRHDGRIVQVDDGRQDDDTHRAALRSRSKSEGVGVRSTAATQQAVRDSSTFLLCLLAVCVIVMSRSEKRSPRLLCDPKERLRLRTNALN
jgi:hypothetical protein